VKNSLALQHVSAGYGASPSESTPSILRDIDLLIGEGELLVIAGPNGSGKSTLLKTAGGLLSPQAGRVTINGKDIGSMKLRERAAYTAILSQGRESPWPFSVRETVAQGRFSRMGWLGAESSADRDAVNTALEKADLTALAERTITELSGGELQRVYIARCIAQGAAFLILDEPENNLDPKYSYKIFTLLAELVSEGRSAIISLHDLRLASHFAHRIALLSKARGGQSGSISAIGPPAEVLTVDILSSIYDLAGGLVRSLIL